MFHEISTPQQNPLQDRLVGEEFAACAARIRAIYAEARRLHQCERLAERLNGSGLVSTAAPVVTVLDDSLDVKVVVFYEPLLHVRAALAALHLSIYAEAPVTVDDGDTVGDTQFTLVGYDVPVHAREFIRQRQLAA